MRRIASVVLALAAFADGPAHAQEQPRQDDERCDGAVADPRVVALESSIRFRQDFKLRAERAFVAEVLRSPSARSRGRDRGFPAITPSEARYFDVLRSRVERAGSRLAPFEREHAAILGGISIEDDFRDGPFLLVRVVAPRPKRFLPRLRRMAGVRVRVRRVAFSKRALRRLQDRVDPLLEPGALPDVVVGGSSIDDDASRVVLTVATRRTDLQDELARRFGPALRVDVLAVEPTTLVCGPLDRVTVGPDDRDLELQWSGSGSTEFGESVVEESPSTVRVGVRERVPTVGLIRFNLRSKSARVRLAAPLGARRLVDAETGRPLAARRG